MKRRKRDTRHHNGSDSSSFAERLDVISLADPSPLASSTVLAQSR